MLNSFVILSNENTQKKIRGIDRKVSFFIAKYGSNIESGCRYICYFCSILHNISTEKVYIESSDNFNHEK